MTSIPDISTRGSLILWAKFQIPVGPRSGREGEKCRPLDHMRQIPFINQALFASYTMVNFYIYTKEFQLFLPYGIHIACLHNLHLPFTHALLQTLLLQGSEVILPLITARAGGKYMTLGHAQLLNCRNCQLSLFLFYFYSKHLWPKMGGPVQHFPNWNTVAPDLPRSPGSPVFPNVPCKKKENQMTIL